MGSGAALIDNFAKRSKSLKTIRQVVCGLVVVPVYVALERVGDCYVPEIRAGPGLVTAAKPFMVVPEDNSDYEESFVAAISSLKKVPEDNFDDDTHASSVSNQLQMLFFLFSDPPARVLHMAMQGFMFAVNFGLGALIATPVFSILGFSDATLLDLLTFTFILDIISKKNRAFQFLADIAAFFILANRTRWTRSRSSKTY